MSRYIRFTSLLLILTTLSSWAQESSDCNVYYTGMDPQLKETRIDIAQEHFFAHTNKKLKPSFKDRDMVVGKANITQIGKMSYLRIEIEIATRNAFASYGYIPKVNVLTVQFLNGDKAYLYAVSDTKGVYDSEKDKTIYNTFYIIDKEKPFIKADIDKIGVFWSTGYEEYIVYDVDLLKRQFACLKQQS